MNNKRTLQNIKELQTALHWKHWQIGVYENGINYLEFETASQYDEYQFDKKSELRRFVSKLYASRVR